MRGSPAWRPNTTKRSTRPCATSSARSARTPWRATSLMTSLKMRRRGSMLTPGDVVELDLGVPARSEAGSHRPAIVVSAARVLNGEPNVVHDVPLTRTIRTSSTEVVTDPDQDNRLSARSSAQRQHVRAVATAEHRQRRSSRSRRGSRNARAPAGPLTPDDGAERPERASTQGAMARARSDPTAAPRVRPTVALRLERSGSSTRLPIRERSASPILHERSDQFGLHFLRVGTWRLAPPHQEISAVLQLPQIASAPVTNGVP